MYDFKADDVVDFAAFLHSEVNKKGNELFFQYCPYCNGGGKDKYTMSVNLDNGAFKCFRSSCGKQGHFVELARDFGYCLKKEEEIVFRQLPQKKPVSKPKAIEYLQSRGISERITEKYNITTQTDNENILVFPFYDEQNKLQFAKYRNTKYKKGDKGNKEWCEKDTKPILFGMNNCIDFNALVITEGQIDSLTLAECGVKNAVSVPTGAKGFTWLQHCWDWINKFNEIIVFGDCEKSEITLIDELSKRLEYKRVKCVREEDYLMEKDANDIFQKYGKEAIVKAVQNAEIQPLKYVKALSDVKSVNINLLPKIKTGIDEIDRTIGGMFYGQVILLSGKRGEGKSTFMSQLVVNALDQNNNIFAYSGELPNEHFKNWIDLQIAGTDNISSRTNEYGDQEYYLDDETTQKINKWYQNKAYIFDNSAIEDDEYEGLIKITKDAICRYGINMVCIDNLMTAIDDNPQSDIYRAQSKFVKDLAKMAKKYNVVVILIAHPKKSKDAFDNDTVSGSADITNAVDVVMNYERYETENSESRLTITKNRLTGKLIYNDKAILLKYSEKCKRIKSSDDYRPNKKYI